MRTTRHYAIRRRGWASLWLVIWLPALLVLFSALLGIANLWLARVELENALEAAALAAIKEWGDQRGGDTSQPRQVGIEFASLNSIRGKPLAIGDKDDGNLIFGAIDSSDPDRVVFDAGICPTGESAARKFGVRAQALVPVRSFGSIFLGRITGQSVQAKATAEYDCQTGRVRLVRIDEFIRD
ncbi:MAG: pilus assembly protein TadG-related protein [Pirellulaceae bacterium]